MTVAGCIGYGAPVSEELSRAVLAEVQRLCQEQGVSGRELSRRTGIPTMTLARKLDGKHPFDLDDLPPIASALQVTIQQLMSRF